MVLKIYASKRKSHIQISQKPLEFSKNAFSKSFVEFYLVFSCFCLKRLRSKLQKIWIAIFGQFWLRLAVFSFFIYLKNASRQSLNSRRSLNSLKLLIHFETKTIFKRWKVGILVFSINKISQNSDFWSYMF